MTRACLVLPVALAGGCVLAAEPSSSSSSPTLGATSPTLGVIEDCGAADAVQVLGGVEEYARFGEGLAWGDLDGDGSRDLAVGSAGGFSTRSAVRLYAASTDGVPRFPVWEQAGPDGFGSALAVGDVDGDGLDDLMIGAPDANEVHVFLGPLTNISTAASVLVPPGYGDGFGMAVSVADVDGDGVDDVAAGMYVEGAHIWFGAPGGPSGPPDLQVPGTGNEQDGTVVALVGDVDGDLLGELAMVQFGNASAAREAVIEVHPGAGTLGHDPWVLDIPGGGDIVGADLDIDGFSDVAAGTAVYTGSGSGPALRWTLDGSPMDARGARLVVQRADDVVILAPGADPAALDEIRAIAHPDACSRRRARLAPAGDLLAVSSPSAEVDGRSSVGAVWVYEIDP